MAEDFVILNTALVRMGPDDVMRGLEGSVPTLQKIREVCPFVGSGGGGVAAWMAHFFGTSVVQARASASSARQS